MRTRLPQRRRNCGEGVEPNSLNFLLLCCLRDLLFKSSRQSCSTVAKLTGYVLAYVSGFTPAQRKPNRQIAASSIVFKAANLEIKLLSLTGSRSRADDDSSLQLGMTCRINNSEHAPILSPVRLCLRESHLQTSRNLSDAGCRNRRWSLRRSSASAQRGAACAPVRRVTADRCSSASGFAIRGNC